MEFVVRNGLLFYPMPGEIEDLIYFLCFCNGLQDLGKELFTMPLGGKD